MGAGRNVFSGGVFSSIGCGFFSSTGAGAAAGAGASEPFTLPFGTNFRTLVSLMVFCRTGTLPVTLSFILRGARLQALRRQEECLSYLKLFQRQPIFFSHRRVTVRVGSLNPALVSLFG